MARKPIVVEEKPLGWQEQVHFFSKLESMRCRIDSRVGIIHPGLVALIPSDKATRYVIGHVKRWEDATPPKDEKPEDVAKTKMDIYLEGELKGTYLIPNASVLCYVDYRMLQPPFKSMPIPPEGVPKKMDMTHYYKLCGSLPIKRNRGLCRQRSDGKR